MLRLIMVAMLSFLLPASLSAEKISGVIYDPDGGVVSSVRVMLMKDYVKQQETKSGESGEFMFSGVQPGEYQLQAKRPNFSIYQQTVILKAGEDFRVYAVLPLARALETITASAEGPAGVKRQTGSSATRAGGNVQPPWLVEAGKPTYPRIAAERGIEGPVALSAIIKTDGTLDDVRVLTAPDPAMAAAAMDAAKNSRYTPMKLNGHVVECGTTIIVNYRLK